MVAEPNPRPSITKIWAKNFRSIEYAELVLGPLTVLVGPNASGKSNLIDVIGFLSDVVRLGLESATTRRGGIDSIGRKSITGRVFAPEIGFQYKSLAGVISYTLTLVRKRKGEYWIRRESVTLELDDSNSQPLEFTLTNGQLTTPSLKRILRRIKSNPKKRDGSAGSFADIVQQIIAESDRRELQLMSPEPMQLTSFLEMLASDLGIIEGEYAFRLRGALGTARDSFAKTGIYHIFPNSLRDPQKVADIYPLATDGENLASTLRDMIHRKSRFLTDLKDALAFAVPGICDIRVRPAGSYYVVELKHIENGRNGSAYWFDLSLESDGTIRLLALLTALFQDPAPSLIGLEEPELAIHPGAMAVLSDTMMEAALRSQIVVATHSPDLIDRLPAECLRAVTSEGGSTRVSRVAEHQLASVKGNLFTAGELHRIEGLQPNNTGQ